jgi:hypothetical protein
VAHGPLCESAPNNPSQHSRDAYSDYGDSWTTGSVWPDDGELDIIEGINAQSQNKMIMHTTAGCKITKSNQFSGNIVTTDCDVRAPEQAANQGCLIEAATPNTYGPDFNDIGGGVYALEWTSNAVSIWFLPRSQIPANVENENPDPSSWGKPIARFAGECDINKLLSDQRIVSYTSHQSTQSFLPSMPITMC